MKELFKIEAIRRKIQSRKSPTRHEWNMFLIGDKEHKVKEKEIERAIEVVNAAHKNAVAFLNKELKKLTDKKNAK